jgi:nitrite reductase/ring-hydroxylating ferredoxin subunit
MLVKLFPSQQQAAVRVPKGTMQLLIIKGRHYNLIHTEEGFIATSNACPHMNEPLHKGALNAYNEVICPLHHYRFNLVTGQESSNRCAHLPVFTIQINEAGVFIEL